MTETESADTLRVASLDASGESGRTPVLDGDPRAVSLRLSAGERVPEHQHPGETVLFLVREGTVELTVGGESVSLSAGELARFDGGAGVAVEAETAAAALVVLSEETE